MSLDSPAPLVCYAGSAPAQVQDPEGAPVRFTVPVLEEAAAEGAAPLRSSSSSSSSSDGCTHGTRTTRPALGALGVSHALHGSYPQALDRYRTQTRAQAHVTACLTAEAPPPPLSGCKLAEQYLVCVRHIKAFWRALRGVSGLVGLCVGGGGTHARTRA